MIKHAMALAAGTMTVLFGATMSCAQVPLDCIGVQRRAAEMRVASLPASDYARYSPVLTSIQELHSGATREAARAEAAWNELKAGVRAASPGASERDINARTFSLVMSSALHDARYADVLRAVYKAHVIEGQVIDKTREIQTPQDAQQVKQLADSFLARHSGLGDTAALAERSPSLRRLASIFEANRVAAKSSEAIPAAALTKPGFDDRGEEMSIAAAARNLSGLLAGADTAGQVSNLVRSHIESRLGTQAERASLMRNTSSRTADAAALQTAQAQNQGVQRGYVVRQISKIESDINRLPTPKSEPEQRTRITQFVDQVQKQVQKVKRVVVLGADQN